MRNVRGDTGVRLKERGGGGEQGLQTGSESESEPVWAYFIVHFKC